MAETKKEIEIMTTLTLKYFPSGDQ